MSGKDVGSKAHPGDITIGGQGFARCWGEPNQTSDLLFREDTPADFPGVPRHPRQM
jgi:hypothetical protein